MDGIGGTIKQLVTRAIMSCRAVIKDAKSLVEAVSQQTCIQLKLISTIAVLDEFAQVKVMIQSGPQ